MLTDDASTSFELLGAAESLRAEINAPRDSELTEDIERQVAAARSKLGKAAVDEATQRGRALSSTAAIKVALALTQAAG